MATAGYPGVFPGALTTGSKSIGAVQPQVTGAAGYPGVFPGALTTGGLCIGAVQKAIVVGGGGDVYSGRGVGRGLARGVYR